MRALIRRTRATYRLAALLLLAALAVVRISPACATATAIVTHAAPMRDCADLRAGTAHEERDGFASRVQAVGHGCVALPAIAPTPMPRLAVPAARLSPVRDAAGIAHPSAPPAPPPRTA